MIKFSPMPGFKDVIPSPDKAGRFIPEYYRKLKPECGPSQLDGTAKRCVPFIEAISMGYIIPAWSDMQVTLKDGELSIDFPGGFPHPDPVGTHDHRQLPLDSAPDKLKYLKLNNPWVIETRKGVSCYFCTPVNHFENKIDLVGGVVDTDNYYSPINFPFIWRGGEGSFLIEKGSPLVHVIPFIRKDFGAPKIGKVKMDRVEKTTSILGTFVKNGYRKCFWHKKR